MCERVNEWVGEWTSVSCPLANPVVWGPPLPSSSSSQPTILWETCSSLHRHCCIPPPPSSTGPHPDAFVSSGDKTGGSLGPPISPSPWGDKGDEWKDPQTVHAYNLSLRFGSYTVTATQIPPCFQKSLLDLKTRLAGPKSEHPDASESLCQKNAMELTVCSPRKAHKDGFWEVKGGLREGEFFPSITKWHKQQYQLGIHYQNKQRHSRRVCNRNPTRLDKLCKLKWWLSRSRVSLWMNTVIAGEP